MIRPDTEASGSDGGSEAESSASNKSDYPHDIRVDAIRERYAHDARFAAMFDEPDWDDPQTFGRACGLTSLSPISEGFTLDDVPTLLEIACNVELDLEEGEGGWFDDGYEHRSPAVLHALQAILRLGEEIKASLTLADTVAKAIAYRVATERDDGTDDYSIEEFFDACAAILMYLGRASLPHMIQALAEQARPEGLDDKGMRHEGPFGDVITCIVLLEGDIRLARDTLDGVLPMFERLHAAYLLLHTDNGANETYKLRRVRSFMHEWNYVWPRFGPALRRESVLARLRHIALVPVADGHHRTLHWPQTLHAAGLECNPSDKDMMVQHDVSELTALWRARHGDDAPPEGPFAGQPGYTLPPLSLDSWVARWECAREDYCTTLLDAVRAPPAATPHERSWQLTGTARMLLSRLRFSRGPRALQACSRCYSEFYCSTACQRAGWSRTHREGSARTRDPPYVPPNGPLRYSYIAHWSWSIDPRNDHRYKCQLKQDFWRDAGIVVPVVQIQSAANPPVAAAAAGPSASAGVAAPRPAAARELEVRMDVPPGFLDALSKANKNEQRNMLGELLYPRVAEREPALAGKITGMLLELETSELLSMLEEPTALAGKVEEAVMVLDSVGYKPQPPSAR